MENYILVYTLKFVFVYNLTIVFLSFCINSHGVLQILQTELIQSKNYTAEAHYVTTSDGYILGLHRIPPANGSGT